MTSNSTQTAAGLAPIVLLTFKRPLATLQTLYTLSRCPEAAASELYVFCDGPRRESERRDVALTREVVRSHPWCGRVEVVEAEHNQGLARSVISAVTRLCKSHGRVIVLEDDLLVARGFLAYMNDALRRYADSERVMTVSAHTFDAYPPEPRAVFLPTTTTWGWATWARAWAQFQEQPRGLARLESRAFRHSLNLDGSFDYSAMLRAQMAGQIDSWGIRWFWSVRDSGGLGLFPMMSLVRNIGSGAGSTHTRSESPSLESRSWAFDNEIHSWPSEVRVDEAAFSAWKAFLRRTGGAGLGGRTRHAIRAALTRLGHVTRS